MGKHVLLKLKFQCSSYPLNIQVLANFQLTALSHSRVVLLWVNNSQSTTYEWLVEVNNSHSTTYEWLVEVNNSQSTTYEWLVEVNNSQSTSYEWLVEVNNSQSTSYEWLVEVNNSQPTSYEWLNDRVFYYIPTWINQLVTHVSLMYQSHQGVLFTTALTPIVKLHTYFRS